MADAGPMPVGKFHPGVDPTLTTLRGTDCEAGSCPSTSTKVPLGTVASIALRKLAASGERRTAGAGAQEAKRRPARLMRPAPTASRNLAIKRADAALTVNPFAPFPGCCRPGPCTPSRGSRFHCRRPKSAGCSRSPYRWGYLGGMGMRTTLSLRSWVTLLRMVPAVLLYRPIMVWSSLGVCFVGTTDVSQFCVYIPLESTPGWAMAPEKPRVGNLGLGGRREIVADVGHIVVPLLPT